MRAEVKAMRAQLQAQSLNVFEGDAPADTLPPYVVLVPARNADEQHRLSGAYATEVVQVTCVSVGRTLDQAGWADDRVDKSLRPYGAGIRLPVPGRRCTPIERRVSDSGPDDSAARLWTVATVYRFRSHPAT